MTLNTVQAKNTSKQCKGRDDKHNHLSRTRTWQTKTYSGSLTTMSQALDHSPRIWMPCRILLSWESNESLQRCCVVKKLTNLWKGASSIDENACFPLSLWLCTHSIMDQPFKESSFKLLGRCDWNWKKEEKMQCQRRGGKGEQLKTLKEDLRDIILEFRSKQEPLCDLQLSG